MNKAIRILVVDDDPDLGGMIKLLLEYRGYAVTILKKAKQAEEIIRGNKYDLVIMDMLLSGVNGIDICTRLKQNNSTSNLMIMMISAHPNAEEACISAGADDFILKPFDMQNLFSKVDSLISKRRDSEV